MDTIEALKAGHVEINARSGRSRAGELYRRHIDEESAVIRPFAREALA